MAKFKIVKPHFRTHRNNGHPSYIYAQSKDEYKYIGITHANNTHGLDNIKLKSNPNPKAQAMQDRLQLTTNKTILSRRN